MSYSISSQFNVFNCIVVFYKSGESDKLVQFERFEYVGVTCYIPQRLQLHSVSNCVNEYVCVVFCFRSLRQFTSKLS